MRGSFWAALPNVTSEMFCSRKNHGAVYKASALVCLFPVSRRDGIHVGTLPDGGQVLDSLDSAFEKL